MELTEQQIIFLQTLLVSEEKKLTEAIERGADSSKIVSLEDPIGRLSRMDAIQQQKMAAEGLRRAKLRLERVRSALSKVDSGEYGYCLSCEEPIHFGRLKISPESTLCIRCQEKSE